MLSINNLTYHIGGRALYEKASLHVKPKDRIGLIGLNGKGKSTLLKLINGDLTVDAGEISRSNECTLGFLNQDLLSYQSADSILTVAMGAFKEAVETQKKIDKLLEKLESEYSDDLVEKLTRQQEKFERLEGYTMQSRAEEILEGIGFSTQDLSRPLKEFSGGWRMRVMLAKLLLENPSILMLDEPTNHLDLPSIEWMENYIRSYDGSVIIVSHDRQFLNNTVNRVVEVTQQQLVAYEGNYDFYLEEKELRSEIQQNAFENQQQKIRQTERFIERFRAKSTKARQVQSRIKSLERMDMVEEVTTDAAAVNFKFSFSQKSGRHIIRLNEISKSYGDLELLRNTSAAIERHDKIALIGANGKGKSTLLRIIAGSEPIEGEREEGYNVIRGFFAQHQLEALNVNNEILDELKQAGSKKTELELRQILGCFLFSDDDVFKKIKVLSGGEKSRVALAKTLISEANFLLLDEPTNHLDFISENILIQALQQYKGSFVVVSHNRHFINQVSNKIWYIEDKEIKEYPGSYAEYTYWRSQQAEKQPEAAPAKAEKKPKESRKLPDDENIRKIRKLETELSNIEGAITAAEDKIRQAEAEMAKPEVFANPDKLAECTTRYDASRQDLDKLHVSWEEIASQIDELS